MAENSKIEWTNHTFNPWVGCQKVSPACDHCYAEEWAKRFGRDFNVPTRTSAANWKKPLKWNRVAEIQYNAWEKFKAANPGMTNDQLAAAGFAKPERPRVFCASLADVFDNRVPAEWREDLFELIRITPHLDWLLLTKRIGNVARMVPAIWTTTCAWPKNVQMGITVCNQPEWDRDVDKLLALPAPLHFVSFEPLLADINLWQCPVCGGGGCERCNGSGDRKYLDIGWAIVGGESGPKARPMHPAWARSLRDQCAAAGVPFLFKQWGEFAPNWLNDDDGDKIAESEWIDRMGKRTAGRLLDGVLHDCYPEARI